MACRDVQFNHLFSLLSHNYHQLLVASHEHPDSVWLFFSFLTVHATQAQRVALISEVRESIMATARKCKNGEAEPSMPMIAFLKAMGIDFSALVAAV